MGVTLQKYGDTPVCLEIMTTFAELMQFLMNDGNTYMIPTSIKAVKPLGWDYIDVILFTGDAFIDHPSFGTAVIARWLQKHGYRVAVVPQPNWRDDLRDFRCSTG